MPHVSRRAMLAWLAATPLASAAAERPRTEAERRYHCTQQSCEPYVYDPRLGDPENVAGDAPIRPSTAFADLPPEWLCPVCGAPKSFFVPYD